MESGEPWGIRLSQSLGADLRELGMLYILRNRGFLEGDGSITCPIVKQPDEICALGRQLREGAG